MAMNHSEEDKEKAEKWNRSNPRLQAILREKMEEGQRNYNMKRLARHRETEEQSLERKKSRKRSIRKIVEKGQRALNMTLVESNLNEHSMDMMLHHRSENGHEPSVVEVITTQRKRPRKSTRHFD